jgi:hypothetical protein
MLALVGGVSLGVSEAVAAGLGIPFPAWRGQIAVSAATLGAAAAVCFLLVWPRIARKAGAWHRRLLRSLAVLAGVCFSALPAGLGVAAYVSWNEARPDSCVVGTWDVRSREGWVGSTRPPTMLYRGSGGRLVLNADGTGSYRGDEKQMFDVLIQESMDSQGATHFRRSTVQSSVVVNITYATDRNTITILSTLASGREGEPGSELVVAADATEGTATFFRVHGYSHQAYRYDCSDISLVILDADSESIDILMDDGTTRTYRNQLELVRSTSP